MAKKKRPSKPIKLMSRKKSNERIILRTGEALVEGDPAWSAAEPEVVIGELDGPVGYAIANLLGDQVKGHSRLVNRTVPTSSITPSAERSCSRKKAYARSGSTDAFASRRARIAVVLTVGSDPRVNAGLSKSGKTVFHRSHRTTQKG